MSINPGYVVALIAMIFYAVLTPISKKLTIDGLTGFYIILINSVMLGTLSVAAILLTGNNFDALKKMSLNTWFFASALGIINFIGFALYIWAVARIPATEYQIMYLASPLVVAIVAYFLLSEPLQLKHLIGGVIVALGIYISIR